MVAFESFASLSDTVNDIVPHLAEIIGLVLTWSVALVLLRHFKRIVRLIDSRVTIYDFESRTLASINQIFGMIVFIMGLAISLYILGVTDALYAGLTAFGIIGIIIGLAGQEVLGNTLAGFVLILDHPFVVGDVINAGEHEGVVQKISLRSTVLQRVDGLYVLVPNSYLTERPIINYSTNPQRRIEIILPGIDLADMPRLMPLANEALENHPLRVPETEITVLADKIESGNADLKLRFWVARTDVVRARSEMTTRLVELCVQEGMALAVSNLMLMNSGRTGG